MTKSDLIERLVTYGLPRSSAMEAVEAMITIIADTLSSGETITLRGLGTFRVVTVKEKLARDIGKCESITVPAHKKVKVILSKKIKNALK